MHAFSGENARIFERPLSVSVTIENKHAIKEWTSIHVFCRTAELAFIKHSTSSRKLNRISEHHKNTIFTILIIYLFNKPADLSITQDLEYVII